jgi:hypothetical protein
LSTLAALLQAFAVFFEAACLDAVASRLRDHFWRVFPGGVILAVPAVAVGAADLAAAVALTVVDRTVGLEAVAADCLLGQGLLEQVVDVSLPWLAHSVRTASRFTAPIL